MKTQHDRLCAGLEAMGAVMMPKKNKYTMYRLVRDDTVRFYFVGKGGALRISDRASISSSISCGDRRRQMVFDAPLKALSDAGL